MIGGGDSDKKFIKIQHTITCLIYLNFIFFTFVKKTSSLNGYGQNKTHTEGSKAGLNAVEYEIDMKHPVKLGYYLAF